jgi:hypothetical protein
MTGEHADRLEAEIRHLRAQNRRYRELIQSLTSLATILRGRLERSGLGPREIRVFERFAERRIPPPQRTDGERPRHEKATPPGERKESPRPLSPMPGWRCLATDRPRFRIGFKLFGVTADDAERAVELVERRQVRSRDFTPVFVTDLMDLEPFRCRGYVVEYLPRTVAHPPHDRESGQRDLERRLDRITAKWGLSDLVDLTG